MRVWFQCVLRTQLVRLKKKNLYTLSGKNFTNLREQLREFD